MMPVSSTTPRLPLSLAAGSGCADHWLDDQRSRPSGLCSRMGRPRPGTGARPSIWHGGDRARPNDSTETAAQAPPVVAAPSRHHGPRLGAEAAQRQRSRPDGDGVAAGRDQAPGRGNGCAIVRDRKIARKRRHGEQLRLSRLAIDGSDGYCVTGGLRPPLPECAVFTRNRDCAV
jgi:hypothetical protein